MTKKADIVPEQKQSDDVVEESVEEPQQRRRGIYLLPNLLTTSALFAGFYSVVAAMNGFFEAAAISVFIAMIADGLDGRVARLTNTESEFGAEYDSLADIISFGVAPGLVAYSWALAGLGKLGWLVAFVYVATTALRLARFNTQPVKDKRYFQGLPSPAAAGCIASLVWMGRSLEIEPSGFTAFIIAILVAAIGALMVSNFRYHSFKELDLKGRVPFVVVLLIVLGFVAISLDPPVVLFSVFFSFALSGPVLWLWKRSRRK